MCNTSPTSVLVDSRYMYIEVRGRESRIIKQILPKPVSVPTSKETAEGRINADYPDSHKYIKLIPCQSHEARYRMLGCLGSEV